MKTGQHIRLTITDGRGNTKVVIKPLLVHGFEISAAFGNTSVEIIATRIHPQVGEADFWYDGEMNGAIYVPKHLW